MADRVGQQLGNYRLTRLLGRGGFAEVYLGEHVHLNTQVAVKVLSAQLASEEVEAFRTEARTVARLEHPNIVRVFDFGIEDSTNTPYLVMSYAPNGTLRRRHPRGVPLPVATIVSYVRQVADALQYAHDEKLIHRDVKPENMLLGKRNEVLLSDFGIAVIAHSTRSQRLEAAIGTVDYMAPEQILEKPVLASDQYALGVAVYEWLCGVRPFQGSPREVFGKQLYVPPPTLREKVPTISSVVEQVVLTALAKEPQQRFGRVQAFATALEQAALSAQPATLAPSSQPPPVVPTTPDESPSLPGTALPPSQWPQPTVAALQPGQQAQAATDVSPPMSQWAQPTTAPSLQSQPQQQDPAGSLTPSASFALDQELPLAPLPVEMAQSTEVDVGPTHRGGQEPIIVMPTERAVPSAARAQPSLRPRPPADTHRGRTILLIGLLLLFIVGGTGLVYSLYSSHGVTNTPQLTATVPAGNPGVANTPQLTATVPAGNPGGPLTVTPDNFLNTSGCTQVPDIENGQFDYGQGYACTATLQNTGQSSLTWRENWMPGSSTMSRTPPKTTTGYAALLLPLCGGDGSCSVIEPSQGTLGPGQTTQVSIKVPTLKGCPFSFTLAFITDQNTVSVPWSC